VRRLVVSVHTEDPGLREDLLSAFPGEGLVACREDRDVCAHGAHGSPDVVFVDAGPPAPASLPAELRAAYPSAYLVLIAHEVDAATLELGAALGVDAYLRRDERPAEAATALVAVAALSGRSRRPRLRQRSKRSSNGSISRRNG
jgi:DNA-binding NarL/FixJ family response regulator